MSTQNLGEASTVKYLEKCTGCHLCELVCSFFHFNKSSLLLSRIVIWKDKARATFVPMACISCPGMPCARVCPTGAIVRDENTGMPKVIESKCLGAECGKCVEACPYHAINFNPEVHAYPLICDLCDGDPQCVKVCWPGALRIVELTKGSSKEGFLLVAQALTKINEIVKKLQG